ncbi:tetratricopeptide repeat protein [Marinimicrobium alkaliphilum]|uniref:tetratricopeptide repeat protein n=1 Tax=Marinimicrobium alkaliphilum TaxID=2202654 RepID=UPI000DB9C23E|nr:tetratricopeptide repeat protein [Marinimicrobium alkaliphilum]
MAPLSRPSRLALTLGLTLSATFAQGQPLSAVADLRYGVTLYHYYQGDPLSALSELMIAEAQGGIRGHGDHPALIDAGISLSFGLLTRAESAYRDLLDDTTSPALRDAAHFYLGKLYYQQGEPVRAQHYLEQVGNHLDAPLAAEHQRLLAQLAWARGELPTGAPGRRERNRWGEQAGYALHNLGAAQARAGQREAALDSYRRLASVRADHPETRALQAQGRVSAGYLHLLEGAADEARDQFLRVPDNSAGAERARLGQAWAALEGGNPEAALAPLSQLGQGNPLRQPAREALLALPHTYERLGDQPRALNHYQLSADRLEQALARLSALRAELTPERLIDTLAGAGTDGIFQRVEGPESDNWLLLDRTAAVQSRQPALAALIAEDDFQTRAQALRDLLQLQSHLSRWQPRLDAYTQLLLEKQALRRARETDYRRADVAGQRADLLARQADLTAQLERIDAQSDALALADPDSRALLARIERAQASLDRLAAAGQAPADAQARLDFYRGQLLWASAQDFPHRRWRSERAARELQRATEALGDSEQRLDQLLATDFDIHPQLERLTRARHQMQQLLGVTQAGVQEAAHALHAQLDQHLLAQRQALRNTLSQARLGAARLQDQMPDADLAAIEHSYQLALDTSDDPVVRRHLEHRLADLAMRQSEHTLTEGQVLGPYFDLPIARYRALIQAEQQDPQPLAAIDLGDAHYQLARAYALDGRMAEADAALATLAADHPASRHYPEAQFRRAERAFAAGDYTRSADLYRAVLETRDPGYSRNARYMLGWSLYRQADYWAALNAFTEARDALPGGDDEPASDSQQHLIRDLERVMAMSFSHLDGPESLRRWQREQGDRPYQHRLYQTLAQRYLAQSRYRDSAATYAAYARQNPNSDRAPAFSARVIDVYQQGQFPSLILPAKAAFVDDYGVGSHYWQQRAAQNRSVDLPTQALLHQYTRELAAHHHARAQGFDPEREPAQRHLAFEQAAQWYQRFALAFPADPTLADMIFLRAEALYEIGDYAQAEAAYAQVAYDLPDTGRGAEAAYAQLLLVERAWQLARAAESTGADEEDTLFATHIATAERFADAYPDDARAPQVLANAAEAVFERDQWPAAIALAEQVNARAPDSARALHLAAWLIRGHSHYDLGNTDPDHYARAEDAYWQAIAHLPEAGARETHTPSRDALLERIAVSVYRQGEIAQSRGNLTGAVALMLSIEDLLPGSDRALNARLDASDLLIGAGQYREAEQVLSGIRRDYTGTDIPARPQLADLPQRLLALYEQDQDWAAAAAELARIADASTDPETRRQALWLQAQYLDRSGDTDGARRAYRQYANQFPLPHGQFMEAAQQLVETYQAEGDARYRHWQQQQIDAEQRHPEHSSARTRWLAAQAATALGEAPLESFAAIPLRLPLRDSLQRKRAALDDALRAQERILAFGVPEFSTRAYYRIGDIYAQLSRDLMDSERPPELNALELEQYELLLEEQAYPFEERAIELHEDNAQRAWDGLYDPWVARSFEALRQLLPGRYHKPEQPLEVSRGIY